MSKKKTSLWECICISGLPWPGMVFGALVKAREFVTLARGHPGAINGPIDYKPAIAIAGIAWGCIFLLNIQRYSMGKTVTLFSWMINLDYEPVDISARRKRRLYPPIDEQFLSDTPDGGIIVGREVGGGKHSRYIVYPISPEKNTLAGALIDGSAGTGKTTLMISSIISMLKNPDISIFCIDIKPEIFDKCVDTHNPNGPPVKKIDFFDRHSFGFDLYFSITEQSTDDEIMSEIDAICRSIISCPADSRNKFFYDSARNLMAGILYYVKVKALHEKRESTFMDGMDYLLMESVGDRIKQILEECSDRPEYIRVVKMLKPYADKKGEAFESIQATLFESLRIFMGSGARWALGDNPRMASPKDLETSSLFLCIPEFHLDEWSVIIRTISESIIRYGSKRPDNPKHKIMLYLDEFPRLNLSAKGGGGCGILQLIALGRSRGCITILTCQSQQQILSAWKREDAKTLFELCQLMVFLSVTDSESAKEIAGWVGNYHEESVNYTENYQSSSYSRTFNDKPVITPDLLMNLQDKGEAVVFIHNKYMRTDAVAGRYYNIKELNDISQKCMAANRPKEE
ncbi:type IV secretory system conjugative DNA transfer family protein [Butyrivibrio sp. NC2007]|uniref:type IV secretory system conjugative DNA transfer family protein n=1 Tax=Butyrivibrio sp. NC2007 TaxID=1280683 RepID=UPI0003B49308|nr:type IV secretory system conjugative DNA transfer family protein [Butyrivibrio sp. NC2007]